MTTFQNEYRVRIIIFPLYQSQMRQLAIVFFKTSWCVYIVPGSHENGIIPGNQADPGSTSCVRCGFLERKILRTVRPTEYCTNLFIIYNQICYHENICIISAPNGVLLHWKKFTNLFLGMSSRNKILNWKFGTVLMSSKVLICVVYISDYYDILKGF